MTAVVGIWCQDGVVIGTDSSATFGVSPQLRSIEQPTDKISIIGDQIILAATGSVGLDQRFCDILDKVYKNGNGLFQDKDKWTIAKRICQAMLMDFQLTGIKPGGYGALIAFPCNDKHQLCEFCLVDFQPEFKDNRIWYTSMGSGQMITDPFLGLIREVFWEEGPPTLHNGIFAAYWAMDHVVCVNPGGINKPIRIATLSKVDGKYIAKNLSEEELSYHQENVKEAKIYLRAFTEKHKTEVDVPEL